MRCPHCGTKLTQKNKFCPECGAPAVVPEKNHSQSTAKGIRLLIIIGILLLIAIIAVGVLVAFGGVKDMLAGERQTIAFSNDPEAISAASQSVVKLNCYDRKGKLYATGSGFAAFEKGVIITNYHVIEDDPVRVELVTESGRKFDIASGIAASIERDIAILYYNPTLAGFDLPLLPINSSTLLQKGENVVAIGSPLGLTNVVSTGVFSGYNNAEGVTDIQFTASISSGSSGGALFNDKGELIGVTYASYEAGQNLNLAVPMEFVESLWKNRPKYKTLLKDFADSLIPHYTVDYVLENYEELWDTIFYLDYWVSSYSETADGLVMYCASSYEEIYDPNIEELEKRFLADKMRYTSAPLVKVTYNYAVYLPDYVVEHCLKERGNQRSIKCLGIEWSQSDQKPYVKNWTIDLF